MIIISISVVGSNAFHQTLKRLTSQKCFESLMQDAAFVLMGTALPAHSVPCDPRPSVVREAQHPGIRPGVFLGPEVA